MKIDLTSDSARHFDAVENSLDNTGTHNLAFLNVSTVFFLILANPSLFFGKDLDLAP